MRPNAQLDSITFVQLSDCLNMPSILTVNGHFCNSFHNLTDNLFLNLL